MIEKFLSQKELVQGVQTIPELNARIEQGGQLNIMMGQTFDDGQPVDILKYALFMMDLSDQIGQRGVKTLPRWLIADHFITDINQDEEVAKVREQIEKRAAYLQRINNVYGGNIGLVFSSQLSQQEEYKRNLSILMEEAARNAAFKAKVLKAVPEDRRSNPNAYLYPFEELATIQSMDTDVKIGPPYERFYDDPARDIALMVGFNRYVSIQLTRGFPFGNPEISPSTSEEIEKFGILPYKKSSKGLGDYRIDPISDDIDSIKELIERTVENRAVIDLLVIAELARQRLAGQSSPTLFDDEGANLVRARGFRTLKDLAAESYIEYINKPLQRGA